MYPASSWEERSGGGLAIGMLLKRPVASLLLFEEGARQSRMRGMESEAHPLCGLEITSNTLPRERQREKEREIEREIEGERHRETGRGRDIERQGEGETGPPSLATLILKSYMWGPPVRSERLPGILALRSLSKGLCLDCSYGKTPEHKCDGTSKSHG